MTSMNAPLARRYWLADAEALAAIRDAEDAPNWSDSELPTAVFCLDSATHEAMEHLAPDENLQIVDLRDAPLIGEVFHAELARERARYLQFTFHAVEDFTPALELLGERLARSEAQAVRTTMLPVTAFGVGEPVCDGTLIAECYWIEAGYLRTALSGGDIRTVSELRAQIAAAIDLAVCEALPLITGAYYLAQSEQPALGEAEQEAARWRARAAKAWSEIDRLKSEKRVRAGREAALKSRHERDLARQAERSGREIDRLYRAAGWAGRWRSRFAGLFGRR